MPIRAMIATDGSGSSRRTEEFTIRLAGAMPLELWLTHVLHLQKLEYKMIPDFQVQMIRDGAKRTAENMLQKETLFFREQGVRVQPRLLVGEPGPTLCEFAQRENISLLITGRHGQGDLQDLMFGSVSNHVVHHCTRPVLVVKKAGLASLPEDARRPVRTLVAVDGSGDSQRCIEYLASLPEARGGMELTLLRVVNPEQAGLEHLPNQARYEALSAMHAEAEQATQRAAERLRSLDFRVEARVEEGRPGRTICRIHQEDGFELIVLGRRGHGEIADLLFGQVCHYVVHHCPGHVLIVP
jgi:nucleotide-binding universal stress UspA family protein